MYLLMGNYYVYAYQGSTQKGMMTGTMASNTFTPDDGIDGMSLVPGTYTFICVNDKVNTSGSEWTVSRENIETARMGIAENVVIAPTPKLQKVTFVMKHVGSRIRLFVHTECSPYLQDNIKQHFPQRPIFLNRRHLTQQLVLLLMVILQHISKMVCQQ